MNVLGVGLSMLAMQALASAAQTGAGPALPYDASKTAVYLGQTREGSSSGTAEGLRRELAATVDIPWCKADLCFVSKLIVAIQAAELSPWREVK